MTNTVLCVDIGTTSLKSGLITDRGEVVSFYTYRFENPCNRFIANEWAIGLGKSIEKLIKRGEKFLRYRYDATPLKISAISISGNGPTVVLPSGLTVRWSERLPKFEIENDEAKKSLFLPKIMALKNLFPESFNKAKYVFSGPEYLIYQLTGSAVTVLPEERFKTAYWTSEILKSVKISEDKLPPFVGLGELCGNLQEDIIVSLRLEKYIDQKLPVFSAGPDFTAAMIGTNTLKAGKICDRSGSSEGFNFCIPRPIFSGGARSLPSVIPGLWNISVLTPSSSKLSVEKRLLKVAASIDKLRQIAKDNELEFPDSMVVTGGQAKSDEYMQKKANITGMKLIVSSCSDSELMGDACCGWLGLGKYSSLVEAADSIFKESIIYENI